MKILYIALVAFLLISPAFGQTNAETWFEKGNEYLANGNDDDALRAYEEAIKIDPSYTDAWYNKGTALQRLGRGNEAEKAFSKSEELFSKASSNEQESSILPKEKISPIGEVHKDSYSFVTGSSETSDFIINFTSKKQFGTLGGIKQDNKQNDNIETLFMYGVDDNESEQILSWRIWWHPGVARPPQATVMNYPIEWTTDELDSKSDATIQGKKALLVKFKEEKKYQGSDKSPLITPSSLCARYFLDKNTEVEVFAYNISKWQGNEFSNLLSTMKITAPSGWE